MRAKQDANTGPQMTLDGLHLHVGGYRRQGSLSPPTQGAAYHPLAAYIASNGVKNNTHTPYTMKPCC